jgi:hypothetical protein
VLGSGPHGDRSAGSAAELQIRSHSRSRRSTMWVMAVSSSVAPACVARRSAVRPTRGAVSVAKPAAPLRVAAVRRLAVTPRRASALRVQARCVAPRSTHSQSLRRCGGGGWGGHVAVVLATHARTHRVKYPPACLTILALVSPRRRPLLVGDTAPRVRPARPGASQHGAHRSKGRILFKFGIS